MANRSDLEDDKNPLDEDWTSTNALQSIGLVALLVAFFFALSLIVSSPDNRSIQTQLEKPQPVTRAE